MALTKSQRYLFGMEEGESNAWLAKRRFKHIVGAIVSREQHEWMGCTCKHCAKVRDEEHAWSGCTCTRCGKQHDFDDAKVCGICGAKLVDEVHETISYLPCNGCSNGSGYGCTGDTSTCIAHESYQNFEYETITSIVYPDGTKKLYK